MNTQIALEFEDPAVTERVSRRARRIRLDLRPDGSVVLTIPLRASRTAAYQFLEQNRAWIARQRARRRLQSTPPGFSWNGRDRLPLRSEALHEAKILLDQESARLGVVYSGLKIRDPRSRWGSCSADGHIMLSLRLLLAPPDVFRYVVIHELCHLRWRGHGPRFWNLVAQQMPDFEAHRRWLRQHGDELQALLPVP